jgi:hypothetical protein
MFAYLSRRRAHLTIAARLPRVIAALAVVTGTLLGWAGAVPIRNLWPRTRRFTIGTAAVIPALLIGVLGGTASAAPQDSGLVACTFPLSTQDVPAADYQKIRAQFAGSRWPDLRNAGTAYVDLATQLLTARGTDGYQTVWFYQRLSAACAKHGQ